MVVSKALNIIYVTYCEFKIVSHMLRGTAINNPKDELDHLHNMREIRQEKNALDLVCSEPPFFKLLPLDSGLLTLLELATRMEIKGNMLGLEREVIGFNSSHLTLMCCRVVHQQSDFSQPESGLVVPVFQKGDDPIDGINHMMSFLTAVVTSRYPPTNNQLRTLSNLHQQATTNNERVTIQPIQGRQNSLTAGMSRQYTSEPSGTSGKQRNSTSPAQQDDLILSVIEQLKTRVVNYTKINQDNKNVNEILTAELKRCKDQNSGNSEEPNLSSSTTIFEVPKELPKVSMAVEQHCVEKNKFQDIIKDVLKENERLLKQAISTDIVNIVLNANVNYACKTMNECEHYVTIETELQRDFINKECYDKLFRKSQPQGNTKKDRIQQTQSRAKKNKLEDHPRTVRPSLHNKKSVVNTKAISSVPNSKLNVNSDLKCATYNGCLFSDNHDSCVLEFINSVNARNMCPLTRITTTAIVPLRKPIPIESNTTKPVVTLVYSRKSKEAKKKVPVSNSKINKSLVVQIVLWYLDSRCSKHMTGDRSQLINFVQKFLGTVKFENDHVAKIMGYGDYKIRNVTILKVYFAEGLGHNLFFVGHFVIQTLKFLFANTLASFAI
nr:hypothetical protein [Tanacetum cinerariifolium]